MGLPVSVYRTEGPDTTLKGVSYVYDRLVVVNVEGPFDPEEGGFNAVMLVDGPGSRPNPILVPAVLVDGEWKPLSKADSSRMFGGNFGYTPDGRMSRATWNHSPLPIHDRFETSAQSAMHSS